MVDVALVEEDTDLGALLGDREEAAPVAAAAHGAEGECPRARRLDEPGDAHANAPEPLGIVAVDDLADVEPGVADLVLVARRSHERPLTSRYSMRVAPVSGSTTSTGRSALGSASAALPWFGRPADGAPPTSLVPSRRHLSSTV
jgi:hypothetical protein